MQAFQDTMLRSRMPADKAKPQQQRVVANRRKGFPRRGVLNGPDLNSAEASNT
jgi:hypothetical protein